MSLLPAGRCQVGKYISVPLKYSVALVRNRLG